jgi:hypothetical protein
MEALQLFNGVSPTEEQLSLLKEKYSNIVVTDSDSLKVAKSGVRDLKKVAKQVDEKRKEINRLVKLYADQICNEINPLIDGIETSITRYEEQIKAEKQRKITEIMNAGAMVDRGVYFVDGRRYGFNDPIRYTEDEIDAMDEEMLLAAVKNIKDLCRQIEYKVEEERKAEEERLRREREKDEEIARLKAELEKLKQPEQAVTSPEINPAIKTGQTVKPGQAVTSPAIKPEPAIKPKTYQDGINDTKTRILEFLSSNEKLTRVSLIEFINKL